MRTQALSAFKHAALSAAIVAGASAVLFSLLVTQQGATVIAQPAGKKDRGPAPTGQAQVLTGKWVTLAELPLGSYCRDGAAPLTGPVTIGHVTITPDGDTVKLKGLDKWKKAGASGATKKAAPSKPKAGGAGAKNSGDEDELDEYIDGKNPSAEAKRKEEAEKREADRKAAEAAAAEAAASKESIIPAKDLAAPGLDIEIAGLRGDGGSLTIRLAREANGLTIAATDALEVRLEAGALKVVDADFDGKPSAGDFFIYGDRHLWMPWHSMTASGKTIYQNLAGKDGVSLSVETRPMDEIPANEVQWFEAWQKVRMDHGVPPGIYEKELSAHCILHADYLKTNKAQGHEQDSGKPGYSPEGHAAGMDCYIAFGQSPINRALGDFMDTAYHRVELINPNHHYLRMGGNDYAYLMSGTHQSAQWHPGDRSWTEPQRYPAPFTAVSRGAYENENPRHPGYDTTASLGLPIICRLPGYNAQVTDVKCQLYELDGPMKGGKRSKEVPCHLSYPGFQHAPGFTDQWNQVMLTPFEILKLQAYEADFAFKWAGKDWHYTWRFEIDGKSGPPTKGGGALDKDKGGKGMGGKRSGR